jgi:hypothetical protein
MAGTAMPPGYPQPMGGAPPGVYVSMYPPPLQQLQAPIRLSRFPGDALHSGAGDVPPGSMPQAAPQQPRAGVAPLQRAGSSGRMSGFLPPGGQLVPPGMMQPGAMHMAGPGGMPLAMGFGAGGMPPHGLLHQYSMPVHMPVMGQHPQLPAYNSTSRGPGGQPRSGQATPKGMPSSGSSTPLHPLQRSLSSGQALPPGYMPAPPPSSSLAMAPPMTQPPPGIVLPDSLSPASPQSLRPAGSGSAAGSRAQSAALLGSGGLLAGPMQPLMSGLPLPLKPSIPRTGSGGSLAALSAVGGGGSLRSSVDYGSGDRTPGGFYGSSGSGGLPKPPSAGSRAASGGRRAGSAGVGAGPVAAPPPELDELDNIKVRQGAAANPPRISPAARSQKACLALAVMTTHRWPPRRWL